MRTVTTCDNVGSCWEDPYRWWNPIHWFKKKHETERPGYNDVIHLKTTYQELETTWRTFYNHGVNIGQLSERGPALTEIELEFGFVKAIHQVKNQTSPEK